MLNKISCQECEKIIIESKGKIKDSINDHIENCQSCKTFLEDYLFLASNFSLNTYPPISDEKLQVMVYNTKLFFDEYKEKIRYRNMIIKIILVAIFSLPFIILTNFSIGFTTYQIIGYFLSSYLQTYFVITFSALSLLILSFFYGFIPIAFGYIVKNKEDFYVQSI